MKASCNKEENILPFNEKAFKTYTVVTHDGKFHPDELFAIALIKRFYGDVSHVIRTRDEEILSKALENDRTILVDVGLIDDAERLAFDHHQTSMTKTWAMPDGTLTPFSATGLVFDYLVQNGYMDSIDKFGIDLIRRDWIIPIDAADNGIKPCEKLGVVFGFNRDNKEENDLQFFKALNLVENVLENIIYNAEQFSIGAQMTKEMVKKSESYLTKNGQEVIIVNTGEHRIDVKYALTINPKIDFFISKREDGLYGIKTAPLTLDNMFSIKNKIPDIFGELKDSKKESVLNEYAGNGSVHFIHKSGFFSVVNGSYEDAVAFAISIKNYK